jgi:site-specific recombinase XerC
VGLSCGDVALDTGSHVRIEGEGRKQRAVPLTGQTHVRSTTPYIHADMTIKERALARVTPASVTPGRYKPPDSVLAFFEGLG